MVAAVVLPNRSRLMTTFDSQMPRRSAAAVMMRRFAWCETNSLMSSGDRLLRCMMTRLISSVFRTANLNTVWPSCFT